MDPIRIVVAAGFVALLVEAAIKMVRSVFENWRENRWGLVAFGVATFFCYAFGVDIPGFIGVSPVVGGLAGAIIVAIVGGLITGRGAQFTNDFLSKFRSQSEAGEATAIQEKAIAVIQVAEAQRVAPQLAQAAGLTEAGLVGSVTEAGTAGAAGPSMGIGKD